MFRLWGGAWKAVCKTASPLRHGGLTTRQDQPAVPDGWPLCIRQRKRTPLCPGTFFLPCDFDGDSGVGQGVGFFDADAAALHAWRLKSGDTILILFLFRSASFIRDQVSVEFSADGLQERFVAGGSAGVFASL